MAEEQKLFSCHCLNYNPNMSDRLLHKVFSIFLEVIVNCGEITISSHIGAVLMRLEKVVAGGGSNIFQGFRRPVETIDCVSNLRFLFSSDFRRALLCSSHKILLDFFSCFFTFGSRVSNKKQTD